MKGYRTAVLLAEPHGRRGVALVHAAAFAAQHKARCQQEQTAQGAACHCQPVCTGLGQGGGGSGSSGSSFRLCVLHDVLGSRRGHSGICRHSILHRGIRGHRGAGCVRHDFGQHHMFGLPALLDGADT